MKYIKTFESILNKEDPYSDDDIKRGDYVLFYYDKLAEYAYNSRFTPELKVFINDNIGIVHTVSDKNNTWIEVIYDNVPHNIDAIFYNNNSILLQKDAIVAFAETKEELEAKISSNKYNL